MHATPMCQLFLSTQGDAGSLIFKLDASVNWPECSVGPWALVPREKPWLLNQHVESTTKSAL